MSALAGVISDLRAVGAIELPAPPPIEMAEPAREPRLPERPVFRHSVIPGGVYTADEVEAAMNNDRVVAAHYSAVNARGLRVETLPEDRAVYMSYRIGDDVFWTKQKVRLKQGETILTDGVNHIRARCGNCIAFAPMEPTADDEPGEMEFDALTDDPEVVQSRMPLGSEWLRQPFAGIPLMGLLGDSADPYAAGNSMGGGFFGIRPMSMPLIELSWSCQAPRRSLCCSRCSMASHHSTAFRPGHSRILRRRIRTIPAIPISLATRVIPEILVIPDDPHNPIFPTPEDPVVVPEPATLLLVGGGLATLVARRRRRR